MGSWCRCARDERETIIVKNQGTIFWLAHRW
jgi:hypothetical protein